MKWLDRLERHFGFIAIPNLMLFVVAGQALATLLALKDPTVPLQLLLDPEAVARGQWWRLFSWVIVPSVSPLSLIFAVFWFMFLWMVGAALEQAWGAFHATVYILLGIFLPSLGAMLLWQFGGLQLLLTGWYFSVTLMLAFAVLAPDYTLYLFLLLPVKMRWMAWGLGALMAWQAVSGGWAGFFETVFGLGNYLLFFLPQGFRAWQQRQHAAVGQKVFAAAKLEAVKLDQRHCADCGAGPEAELRLCTCAACGEEGRFWCSRHLEPHLKATPPSAPPPQPTSPGRAAPGRRAPVPKKSGSRTTPNKKGKG